jgi:hypothetical protein
MAPTGDDIRVAIEALRADARTWSAASGDLADAAATAERLTLAPPAFGFAAAAAAGAHESLRVKVADLLRQGAANFDDVAGALRTAADSYEADEAANLHMLRNIY